MDLNWLEDFVSLAETGNFSRSAAKRNITQPAFSRHIRRLEDWVGSSLINRSTFPATLTPVGRAFLDVAKETVQTLKDFHEGLPVAFGSSRASIKICAANTLMQHFLPDWLAGDEALLRAYRFSIKTQNYHEMFDDLQHGQVDLVVQFSSPKITSLCDPKPFESMIVGRMEFPLVVKVDTDGCPLHFLETGTTASSVPFLGYTEDGFFHKLTAHILRRNSHLANVFEVAVDSPTCEVLKSFMLAGKGIGWFPECCIAKELQSGQVKVMPIDDDVETLDVVIYRSKENRRPPVERLWGRFLEKSCQGS